MTIPLPQGFQYSAVHSGVKRNPAKEDLTLIYCEAPAVAAGVYTQNRVVAAPVILDRQRTPSANARVLVVNSGNANACTGQRGMDDAQQMTRLAAEAVGAGAETALVMSTGIIGEYLPMEKISAGIKRAAETLANTEDAFFAAARGILTTDNGKKVAHRTIACDGREVRIAGFCKGAGMIGPKMATMLGVVLTDAPLPPDVAQSALKKAVDVSFNCISVEGHTSTNDTVLLFSSGAAGEPGLSASGLAAFEQSLQEMCIELAKMIPDDGEGASHLITIEVRGCKTDADAEKVARTVAQSNLVKAGVAGADPNWGRVVSAAGYSGADFDPNKTALWINDTQLFEAGTPVPFDAASVSASIREHRETRIVLDLSEGEGFARHWTSDLTPAYVRFNSEYRT